MVIGYLFIMQQEIKEFIEFVESNNYIDFKNSIKKIMKNVKKDNWNYYYNSEYLQQIHCYEQINIVYKMLKYYKEIPYFEKELINEIHALILEGKRNINLMKK